MTQTDLSNPIFTAIKLADAVGSGDGATIRLISSDVKSDVIQSNTTQTFLFGFTLLNQLDGNDFPHDVWGELPKFLIPDIKDRVVMLGSSEELMSGMVGSFLQQNLQATITSEQAKLLNPDGYSAGYFNIAAAMGEAVFGLIKVSAKLRFNGDYQLARNLLVDYIALNNDIKEAEAGE